MLPPALLSGIALALFAFALEIPILFLVWGPDRAVSAAMATTLAGVWLAVSADTVRAYQDQNEQTQGLLGFLATVFFFVVAVAAAAEWARFGDGGWFVLAYGSLVVGAIPSWFLRARILSSG
jgi:K+ transporter